MLRRAALAAALLLIPLPALAVPKAGKPAPAFTLPSPSGSKISLAALRGKPLYVNFFATWCGPCNTEAPAISKLRAKYAKSGLQVVGIDELEGAASGASFQKKHNKPYSLVAYDEDGTVGKDYVLLGLPVHIFIDRHGIVKTYHPGEMNESEMEAAIKDTLK